jgi:peptidoglycan/xylan/chitin deacetylase (PgdA/CDA1 family)
LKAGAGLCLGVLTLGSLSLLDCERRNEPAAAAPAQPGAGPHAAEPWRFHFVGGLLVVEGELDQPTELILKGRTLSESCRVPLGPVRWELYRPPPGEVAELRTREGKLLARWDFDAKPGVPPVVPAQVAKVEPPRPVPPPKPVPVAPPPPPVAKVEPPKPKPMPPPLVVPPGPWARIEPHLRLPKPPPPPVRTPPPPPVAMAEPPRPKPVPAPVVVPPGPWARIEPHLPLPKPVPAAPPAVRTPPPPPVAKAEPPKPKPVPPPMGVPPGPWARIEPHLPLPKPVQSAPPPVRATPPPPVAKAEQPKTKPVPVPPPVRMPPAPVAKVEPPRPVPVPPPPVRTLPPVAKVEPSRPMPVPPPPVPTLPPVAKVEPSRPMPAPPPPAAAEPVPPAHAASVSAQDWPGAGEGLYLLRGPKGGRRICMTFDGGSTAEVATDVLDVLRDHGIKTTLFLTGDFIRKYPDLVRRMAAEGHELGNHTLTHPHLAPRFKRDPQWTRERVQRELLDADRALYRLLGRPMDPYWRPPFGEQTAELRRWAEEVGYRTVGWSEGADTLDWTTVKEYNLYRNGNATLERLEKRMRKSDGDGLIVLMHLGSMRPAFDRPAKYLGPFMDRAIKDGWHFVCVGDYLKSMGKPRWDSAHRLARINQD